jgi:hypothetical protein
VFIRLLQDNFFHLKILIKIITLFKRANWLIKNLPENDSLPQEKICAKLFCLLAGRAVKFRDEIRQKARSWVGKDEDKGGGVKGVSLKISEFLQNSYEPILRALILSLSWGETNKIPILVSLK